MPWLTTEGASHQIAEGETVVGSGARATWQLPSQDLAARHFVLERSGPTVSIRPCGVDSVIAINGRQAAATGIELHDGDTIDAGESRFLFSSERSGSFPAVSVGPAHLIETRAGVAHSLTKPSVGIGRDRQNVVIVRDATASRFHAEIRREAGGYVLHPHGSSGTLVNGRRLGSPERLQDGDRIEIANMELRFVAGPVPEGARSPEPSADDGGSQRPTVIQSAATEIPSVHRRSRKVWLALLVLVVAVATVWLATR